ncbi:MAG: hypothetical protein U0522_00980 [Candidatus Paceibacterota bacterium]
MRGPSKKIIFIIITCAVVLGGIYLSSKVKSEKVFTATEDNTQLLPDIVVNENVKNTSTIDTDGDGLKDWEEVLWKTNPLKSDTDGNGISDAKEVEKKQLQNSKQAVATVGGKEVAEVYVPENLTLTDKVAMETFAQYVNYKQTGVPITPEFTQKLVDAVFGNATEKQNLAKFTSKNLSNIVENENADTIHKYGNDFWGIVAKNTPKTALENEYVIFLNAIQAEDEKELKKLDPLAEGYTNTIKEMLVMPVPRSAVERHLDILNSMNSILAHIEDMRVYFKDPTRGFRALVYYKDSVPELQKSLENLISYFKEKNITYVEEESGYSLMHSI